MKRIQQQVDEFASLEPPTDFDSLLKALHVWVKRRGIFEDEQVQWQCLVKLMAHLLNRKDPGATFADHFNVNIVPWAEVAGFVVRLHQRFRNGDT
jgi:hypothetical protein